MQASLNLKDLLTLCNTRKIKLTPLRKTILTHLYRSDVPLTAYAILEALAPEHPKLKAMSVYRILDFLIEHGIAHRIESLNAYAICSCPDTVHQSQWLICEECDKAVELSSESLREYFNSVTDKTEFAIRHSNIELLGTCLECQNR